MLKNTGEPVDFIIKTPAENVESSILRVSIGRNGGSYAPLNVSVNGYSFEEYDLYFSNRSDRYFGYVDYKIPVNILEEENKITVSIDQSGRTIFTVALIHLEK